MDFNFGQYLRTSSDVFTSQIISKNTTYTITEKNSKTILSFQNLVLKETYLISLRLKSLYGQEVTGKIYLKENSESEGVEICNFTIPSFILEDIPKNYNTSTELLNTNISIGSYVTIGADTSTIYKKIHNLGQINEDFLEIGNIDSSNSKFLRGMETTETSIEKMFTIKNKIYQILEIEFNRPYEGFLIDNKKLDIEMFRLLELMNNNNYIPYKKIKHLGIQGKPNMKYCINGDELKITNRGIEEFFTHDDNNPIVSIKVYPKDDFFLIDYEYIE